MILSKLPAKLMEETILLAKREIALTRHCKGNR